MSKTKSKTYLFHEISSYLPLLEGEEFDALVEDIRLFGQIEPAVLFEGKIIDGRNRYRACKKLNLDLKVREWNPSKLIGMTPLQFVISENIMRRHLNVAQRSEIGLLLLEEEERLAKERKSEIAKLQSRKENGTFQETPNLQDLVKTEELGEMGSSQEKVGRKVKVGRESIRQAKAIKKIAEKEPIIAKEWEKAKKGDVGVETVYKKAKTIEKLPEDLKKEVRKEKPTITMKEAKVIAEIPSEELRKKEIAERVIVKKRQEAGIKKKVDIAEGKQKIPDKFFNKDANKIEAIKNICKKAMSDLTIAGLEGYGDFARKECIQMMRILFEHLRKELKKAGEVAPRKVLEVDVD